jgi:hypothetical protein
VTPRENGAGEGQLSHSVTCLSTIGKSIKHATLIADLSPCASRLILNVLYAESRTFDGVNTHPILEAEPLGRWIIEALTSHRQHHLEKKECALTGTQCCGSGSPGSRSVSTRYGSGSFFHQAKVIKNLDSNCFVIFYDFLKMMYM